MNKNMLSAVVSLVRGRHRFWLPLTVLLLFCSNASAQCPGMAECTGVTGHDMPVSCPGTPPPDCSYAATPGLVITDCQIGVIGAPGNVYWELAPGTNCSGSDSSINCLGMDIALPTGAPDEAVAQTETVKLSGTAQAGPGESQFTLTVTDATDVTKTCSRAYIPRVTSGGGGWGDPHITTVDGVKYDFQSAGEFIALKGDGIEIQTRQTRVATSYIPGKNDYTGLRSCVSIYTAVAARVGTHRVTIQPNINGVPDPSGLQIRVDGVLKTLGPDGIDLSSCVSQTGGPEQSGRIVRSADDEGIEIHYTNGTKLVVTPKWWGGQQKWYLNVNVYGTIASDGVMGRTVDYWLPAKQDGTSVGAKASDLHDRYVQLYETFADSWRVSNDNSLFDYATGTSTATFTDTDWPRENPTSCLIENEPTAKPLDEAAAEEACRDVVDANNRANCIFDVRATGFIGFADTYVRSEKLTPGATQTLLASDKNESKPGTKVTFSASVTRAALTLAKVKSGNIQFILDGKNAGQPMTLNADGKAEWSTSNLTVGPHQITAKYSGAAGFSEQYLASTSKAVSHNVAMPSVDDGFPLWRIILILIILIAMIIWWLSSRKAAHLSE